MNASSPDKGAMYNTMCHCCTVQLGSGNSMQGMNWGRHDSKPSLTHNEEGLSGKKSNMHQTKV